jgi:hypothetical protein
MGAESMATAPRDGSELLLLCGSVWGCFWVVGRYYPPREYYDVIEPGDRLRGAEWVATVFSPCSDYAPALWPLGWRRLPEVC